MTGLKDETAEVFVYHCKEFSLNNSSRNIGKRLGLTLEAE